MMLGLVGTIFQGRWEPVSAAQLSPLKDAEVILALPSAATIPLRLAWQGSDTAAALTTIDPVAVNGVLTGLNDSAEAEVANPSEARPRVAMEISVFMT